VSQSRFLRCEKIQSTQTLNKADLFRLDFKTMAQIFPLYF
jgi:hypothetical protein